ncbi:NAD(P)-binding protein [Serratia sp. NPDC078593]|uniref:NAD(P)-binding protein n=1 Tax=unclassified Serratia (in: enterobacteria) TaxID=2647522 RepID=UPI0037D1A2B8
MKEKLTLQHVNADTKSQKSIYDVIIVGAGPAGLSVASELAKKYRVLLVDARIEPERGQARMQKSTEEEITTKNTPGKIRKSWFCPHDCLYDNPDIVHCRKANGVMRFLAKTYSGPNANEPEKYDLNWQSKQFAKVPLADRYPYLDEYKLIAHWEQKIIDQKNGSHIKNGHIYQDHRVIDDGVEVRFLIKDPSGYSSKLYKSRLLLDASGHDSDILKAYNEKQKHVYWWTVFGAICQHPEGDIVREPTAGHPLVVGDYMLWQTFADSNADPSTPVHRGRPIFEYEIFDERTSFPLVLYLRPYKISLERAKAEFLNILKHEPAAQAFKNVQIKELKFGCYPSGDLFRSRAQNHVDFIGDAGLWTTPCGWGASFVLKNYASYAQQLSRLLDENRLDKASLRSLAKKHSKHAEFFMNTVVTRFLSYGTVEQLDGFIGLFRKIDPIICERIFTLRAEPHDLLTFARVLSRDLSILSLFKAMPRRERFHLMTNLIQAVAQFLKEGMMARLGRKPERGFGVFKP